MMRKEPTENGLNLHDACKGGMMETVKVLLDLGAEVDRHNPHGWTALSLACFHGHPEAAKLLLDRGAKVDIQTTHGWAALMCACHEGHTKSAKLLLDRGAGVDMRRTDGWTALMSVCLDGCTETAKLLLDRGAKVDLQKTNGTSALMFACLEGHTETAKLLLDRGAIVDLQDANGWTALMTACLKGHTETAKLLLDRRAQVDLQDTNGSSALMWACQKGQTEVATLLLNCGAKVDLQDGKGRTAFVRATQGDPSNLRRAETDRRAVSIITLLCTRSIRLSFVDLGGPVALATARENNLHAAAELLEFLSESSPLAPYGLPLKALVSFYAGNIRTPQAAADLSSPELWFMGLVNTNKRHKAMERFRAAANEQQSDADTLEALTLKVEQAREAHKRGQDAIDRNMGDLESLLSLRPCNPAVSHDFDEAMNSLCEAIQRLKDLQARVAGDASLVNKRDGARDKLTSLATATISRALQHSTERLHKTDDPEAVEKLCIRVWACLSDDPLARQGDFIPSDEATESALQAARAAIATWKQREKVILARRGTETALDKCEPAAQALDLVQSLLLWLRHPTRHPTRVPAMASEPEAVKSTLKKELEALRVDDPMADVPFAEIRCALEMIIRRHAEARQIELARCRAAAHTMQLRVDELVKNCSKPSTAAVENLIDRIYEAQTQREVLETELRHAKRTWIHAGARIDADALAIPEEKLDSLLKRVYRLDHELRRERARVIRRAERYSPELPHDPAWREQVGLPSEALVGVGKLELWLAYVTRTDFAQVEPLATRLGKVVYKVRDPEGREMVLKSFHLSNEAWRDRFCRQVQALAELKSAYLVHIEALFVDASFGCILMPYYAGGDLAAWIRDNPHASDETRKRIAVGVLSGVYDLHQRKLVHCDIKAENIFLTETLTPVLGDFETMTQPLEAVHQYVAPELRADGAGEVAPALDLYSVGVVLSEIFPTPSAALQDLIHKLQADDRTQRPSALEALGHEAFQTKPMRSCVCLVCRASYPETEGVCCESDHFACRSCLGTAVRAASRPGNRVQLNRDFRMPCVAPGCECELVGSDLSTAVLDELI